MGRPATLGGSPAIEARGVTKRFGGRLAVDGVDLAVARGEIFGLVGPNGAGKTTLLQLLAALLAPTGGEVVVLGHDVRRAGATLRRRLGYVSQAFTLYGTLSVAETLDFFADLYGVPADARRRRTAELLAWSRLAAFQARRAGQLSGGMQKKLHLCSTLIHEPDLLLLDEPTTGVDPVSRRELWEILHDLAGRGLTLVVATPYMDEAEQCHRVALMHGGRILRCDTPTALLTGLPETVWELTTPSPGPARERLRGVPLRVPPHARGTRLRILAPPELDVPALLAPLRPADTLGRATPSMEDVFVATVAGAPARPAAARPSATALARPRESSGEVAVRLDRVSRRFGAFTAVADLSLVVERGEVFGFLGPNGCGKTTTIRMLCGLLPPSAGRGEVLGDDIVRQTARIRSRIGYMSQRFSLYDDLTVGENLAFFGGGYGLAGGRLAARTAWVLDMAGLRGDERRLARELSGGVKQRLALGCAILHEPAVVFLDEPTAGVDPIARREFWDLIAGLAIAGTTVFVTTHYLDEAENCDRLALMYQGRLIALGSPQALRDGMRAGVMLEVETTDPVRALRVLRASPALGHATLFGRRLHVLVDDAAEAAPRLRAALEAAGLPVARITPIPLSLEDLFVTFIDMVERGGSERAG
jgi:drug efflux transport system ATP-binding protein